jgi:magnesium-transporting ATPase (P-type)
VNKQAERVLPEDASLGDRINLVYQGTEVVQGARESGDYQDGNGYGNRENRRFVARSRK